LAATGGVVCGQLGTSFTLCLHQAATVIEDIAEALKRPQGKEMTT